MSFTTNQKSQLAKLMATENLTVEHQKIRTAAFDPTNRVLYLPIWQDMSSSLYDLLTGHEVGHALYTPADGWHNVVKDKQNKNFKSFINVVEDARIEKKIKRKYPGLNRSFKEAYQDLMDRDFFGLKGRDINDMAFINRLNLYTKSQYTMDIRFTPEEQVFVDRVQKIESWDEVMSLSKDIYDYSKSEQFEMMQLSMFQMQQQGDMDEESFDTEDFDYDLDDADDSEPNEDGDLESNDGKGKPQESEKQDDAKENKVDEKGSSKTDGEDGNKEESQDSDGQSVNRDKQSQPSDADMFNPECETDDNFRQNEDSLLDMKCREYVYIDLPEVYLDKIVTPAVRVQEQLSEYYDEKLGQGLIEAGFVTKLVNEFKSRNERYVGLLAKEFEMKKAAKAFSKAKVSDTGDIDVGKLATYQFNDNIFRKVMNIPKGKSHGLQLLLDCSGSMSRNMSGSIEQVLILAMFCRKVNIPFEVYGFSDDLDVYYGDHKVAQYAKGKVEQFSRNLNELEMPFVQLRQYINSRMSNAEFNRSLRNMLLLKQSYIGGRWDPRRIGRPMSERLTNTPLTQALFAMAPIMNKFRQVNNLDLTNLVIIHDGDSDSVNSYYKMRKDYNDRDYLTGSYFDANSQNVFLRDKKTKFTQQVIHTGGYSSESIMVAMMKWFTHVTKSKIFGFFILDTSSRNVKSALDRRYTDKNGVRFHEKRNTNYYGYVTEQKQLIDTIKKEKFIVSHSDGYNEFYLILGGDSLTTDEDDELEIDGKITAAKLKRAFSEMNKKKVVNRVLVSRFIGGIAA